MGRVAEAVGVDVGDNVCVLDGDEVNEGAWQSAYKELSNDPK